VSDICTLHFATQCINVFGVSLSVNSDYFKHGKSVTFKMDVGVLCEECLVSHPN